MPESTLAGKKWSGMQFARADLARSALKLMDKGEVWVPGEPMTGKVAIGACDRRLIAKFGV